MRLNHPFQASAARPARARGGFTMIETIGVLVIIALLATVITGQIITRIRIAARNAETATLAAMAQTLHQSVSRTKSLPAQNTLASFIADEMSQPLERVLRTRPSGNDRWFLVDPAARVGTNAASTLPFTQTAAGSRQPVGLRMLVVSSTGDPLPALPTATNAFSVIWNTAPGSVPTNFPADWAGNREDLKIQRMDLGAMFCRVILENVDYNRAAPYSVETTNTLRTVPTGSRREFWLLSGTVLNFHYPDIGNTLQAREYITEDVGYTFENGRWGRYLRYGPNRGNGWFGEMVDRFLAARPPPGATRRYSTQQWVVDAMYTFLYNFGGWSLESPPFHGGPPWPHIPGYEQSAAGAQGLADYSGDLLINQ
jgi:type II secretory pathway pseudopilin PulG